MPKYLGQKQKTEEKKERQAGAELCHAQTSSIQMYRASYQSCQGPGWLHLKKSLESWSELGKTKIPIKNKHEVKDFCKKI